MNLPAILKKFAPVLAACLCLAACRRPKTLEEERLSLPSVQRPDQVIEKFSLDSYSGGLINTALKAPRAEVYESSEVIELSTPAVRFFEGGELSSTLNAGRGRVHTDTHDVWAWDDVVIKSTDNVTLTSDWMHYSSAEGRILSTASVVIVQEGAVIHGQGWEASPRLDDIVVHRQKVEIKRKPK